MLATCKNDDQLGFILGHEIAHTVLSHGVSKLKSLLELDLHSNAIII